MKKLFLLILPVLALSFSACDNDDDTTPNANPFSINGGTYNLAHGEMTFWGGNGDLVNVDLDLWDAAEEYGIWFELFVPSGNKKLLAGTYTFDSGSDDSRFTYGKASTTDGDFDIVDGTVVIAVSGSTYTITVDCTLENGGTAKGTYKGTYKGTLLWTDATDYK